MQKHTEDVSPRGIKFSLAQLKLGRCEKNPGSKLKKTLKVYARVLYDFCWRNARINFGGFFQTCGDDNVTGSIFLRMSLRFR